MRSQIRATTGSPSVQASYMKDRFAALEERGQRGALVDAELVGPAWA